MSNKVIVKTASTTLMIILLSGLAAALAFANSERNKRIKQEEVTRQLSGNYKALSSSFQAYKIKADKQIRLNVAKAYSATVEIEEWNERNKQNAALIRKMGVMEKDITSITTATLITTDTTTAEKVDIKKGLPDTLHFGDARSFMKAKVHIDYQEPKKSTMTYQYTDSLLLTNEFEQKKFWFIKLGKRFKTAHLISKDKNCQIAGFEYRETIK